MRSPLVFASRNPHKLAEISEALAFFNIRVLPCDDSIPEIAEEGASLRENAQHKARVVSQATRQWALGDDTGLFVKGLAGGPGVHTARYAGPQATAAENRAKLLAALASRPQTDREAYFECCLALSDPDGQVHHVVSGRCHGVLLADTQGDHGFGYDSLFLVREYRRTLAEFSLVTKSALSHRGRAAWKIAPKVVRLLGG